MLKRYPKNISRAGKSKKQRSKSSDLSKFAVTTEDIPVKKKTSKSVRTTSSHSTISETASKNSARSKRRKYNRVQPAFWPMTLNHIYGNKL